MKSILNTIPSVAVVLAGVLLSLQVARGQTAVVAVSPANRTVAPTMQFTVGITVSAVVDLHAANVRIVFNKTVLAYDQVIVGSFLPGAFMPTPYVKSGTVFDTVTVDQAILGPGSNSGSGTLFTISFEALAEGTTPIIIQTADLRSSTNTQIPNTRQDGQVIVSLSTVVNMKAYLEGPFNGSGMNTTLRNQGIIPSAQPYSAAPWSYAGTENVASMPAGVVDWVLIELRSTTTTTLASRAAFIKSDGSVVDLDGVSTVGFPGVPAGTYYIVIRHRNHLAAMSASGVSLNSLSALYDFTLAGQAFGTGGEKDLGSGKFGLWAGNKDGNSVVDALDRAGTWNDRNKSGYFSSDVDLSGIVDALDRSVTWNNRNRTSSLP